MEATADKAEREEVLEELQYQIATAQTDIGQVKNFLKNRHKDESATNAQGFGTNSKWMYRGMSPKTDIKAEREELMQQLEQRIAIALSSNDEDEKTAYNIQSPPTWSRAYFDFEVWNIQQQNNTFQK